MTELFRDLLDSQGSTLADVLCGDKGPNILLNNNKIELTKIQSIRIENELLIEAIEELRTKILAQGLSPVTATDKLAARILRNTIPGSN